MWTQGRLPLIPAVVAIIHVVLQMATVSVDLLLNAPRNCLVVIYLLIIVHMISGERYNIVLWF